MMLPRAGAPWWAIGLATVALAACVPQEGAFEGECDDGVDNDRNGVTDCDEPQCEGCKSSASGVCINEFMAANSKTVADDAGAFSDWIELHNRGRVRANLENFTITDDLADPRKHRLEALAIPAGAFRVLWASDVDVGDDTHLPFKLSKERGAVGLYAPDGQPVDELVYEAQADDVSSARVPDCGATWVLSEPASPGGPNPADPAPPADE